MTKLIPQLSFCSSNYDYETTAIEPNPDVKKKINDEDASMSAAGSKRSALSASDAECFSLCLGAGPLCSAPPGGVSGGAASPATTTTTHDDNNCDLLSALLCGGSLSGSAETLVPRDSGAGLGQQRDEIIAKILERKDRQPVKVHFKIFLTESTASHWEAVVRRDTLYLRVPGVLSSGSKESFIVLLECAEERLACSNCILCVRKSRDDRTALLRTFMFLGFQILGPDSPLLPTELACPDSEYVFLHCAM